MGDAHEEVPWPFVLPGWDRVDIVARTLGGPVGLTRETLHLLEESFEVSVVLEIRHGGRVYQYRGNTFRGAVVDLAAAVTVLLHDLGLRAQQLFAVPRVLRAGLPSAAAPAAKNP